MKKKVLVLVVLVMAAAVMLAACGGSSSSETKTTEYETEIYTDEDMQACVKLIEDEFSTWKGCEMNSLEYAGDECNTEDNVAWANEISDGKNYTQVAEFLSDFHSPTDDADLEGTAWEKDKEYEDYQWWLAREDGGDWELFSWGY